jgi:hypothetical protein
MRLKPVEAVEQHSSKEKEPKPKQQPAIVWSTAGLMQHRAAEGTEMEDAWLAQLLLIIHPELWDDAALAVRTFDSFLNSHIFLNCVVALMTIVICFCYLLPLVSLII